MDNETNNFGSQNSQERENHRNTIYDSFSQNLPLDSNLTYSGFDQNVSTNIYPVTRSAQSLYYPPRPIYTLANQRYNRKTFCFFEDSAFYSDESNFNMQTYHTITSNNSNEESPSQGEITDLSSGYESLMSLLGSMGSSNDRDQN